MPEWKRIALGGVAGGILGIAAGELGVWAWVMVVLTVAVLAGVVAWVWAH
jgi:hypothetical protein